MRLYSQRSLPEILPDHVESVPPYFAALKKAGLRAAYAPLGNIREISGDFIRYVREEARRQDIVFTEAGAWCNNPLHPDPAIAAKGIEGCQNALYSADLLGAICAVNIAGSRNAEIWDGPHPDNFTSSTFDAIVESIRKIVDGVKPQHAKYVLETWCNIFPHTPESYLDLIKAIDRDSFAVHLDIANMMRSPEQLENPTKFIHHCFDLLGPYVVAIHAKDLAYENTPDFLMREVIWGQGVMDLETILTRASQLQDVPIGLEHQPTETYPATEEYFFKTAEKLGLEL